MKFKELIEGKVYTVEGSSSEYAIKDGLLFSILHRCYSQCNAEFISQMEFKEVPWVPADGEEYYFINASNESGYEHSANIGDKYCALIVARVEVYKTKEEVIDAIYKLGWEVPAAYSY